MKTEQTQVVDAEDMSGHWPRSAADLAAPDQAAAWKAYRKTLAKKINFEISVPGLRTVLGNLPKEPDTLDVESAAALLYADGARFGPDRGVEYLSTRMRPVEVLKALLLAATYRTANTETFPFWKALLRASPEERSEAQALAEERWERATLLQRATLVSCFPDHADWALKLSDAMADTYRQPLLSATLQDLEALRTLPDYGYFYSPQLVNVVENLPLDAATIYLDECFGHATIETEQRYTANALARICTPAAAAVFVKHMRKKVIKARATTYFTDHPELAAHALGELAKKKTKLAAAAQEILERAKRVLANTPAQKRSEGGEVPEEDKAVSAMKPQPKNIVDAEDMSGYWPRSAAGLAAPLSQTDAWKRLRKKFPKKKKFDFDASVPGLRVALANLPKEPDSLDVESAAALVHASEWAWLNPDEGVEYLCLRMSPLDALKALLLATTYRGAGYEAHRVEISEKRGPMTARTFPYWKALLRASDEEQKKARAFAEARWSDASVNEKGTLLACFPDRAEWALAHSQEPSEHIDFVLLATLQDPEALRKVEYFGPQQVNAVENLSLDEAAAYFDDCFARAKEESTEKPTANALARMLTPAAAAVFVKHMRKKVIRARAVAYFTAHPELAAGALGELAKKKTKLAATAREILERAERSDVSASSAVDEGVNNEVPTKAAPEAKLSEVPEVLRAARWPKKRKASKTKPLEDLAIPTEPCRMHWPLLSRQRHLIDRLSWAQKDERAVSQHVGQPLARIKEAAADPDSEGDWFLDGILAKHGDEAAHAVASVIQQKRGSFSMVRREVLESPAIATRLDREGSIWRWMRRYPEAAVAGLVPATLMAEGKLRAAGEARLRWMQLLGHGEAVRQAADGHGDTARSMIDAILAADPYDEVPAKAPKMGKSYRPAELRAPVLKSGKRLPLVAVERLCEILAFSETTPAYIGIQDVREACTASSLSDFAWDLAKGWSLGGHKSNELWMLHAIEHYGDDEAVRRLTPELKGSGIASMLEDIATDAALMELGNIKMHCASLTRAPKYAEGHEEAIAYIALQRGVTIDELEEEYVPTVGGLDETGAVTLDLGPTKVRVTFDATLLPLLHDEDGERLKALPRGKKSDPAKLKIAKSALKELEQDVTVIGRQRIESLRRALVQQRSWSKERFAQLFVRHPLMRYMTRALIWQAVDGVAFRVAEDGTFADLDESELTLPDTTHVRLCHPLSLSAKERAAWGEILADYDLIQPIEQLSMDVSFPDVGDAIELTYEGVSYETMPDPNIVMPSLGWTTTSQHNGIAIGDHIVILYVRHPKLIVRVLNMELKQIPIKDAEPRARIAIARACDALMTTS